MTTLDSILRIGISGLNTAQSVLTTTSTNIANVNTPNYSRRIVQLESQVAGTNAAGVRVAEIRRVVDLFLEKELRSATSDTARYEAMSSLHERLQALLGRPDENITFTGKLDTVFDTLAELPLDPDSDVRRLGLVQDLQDFGIEVARIADQIQDLRKEADRQVSNAVEAINDSIERVFTLNPKIAREEALGRDAAALVEQRAQAVAKLSELIDINVPVTSSGQFQITTSTGVILLDAIQRKLIYSPTGTVTSNTTFPEITVNKIDRTTGIFPPPVARSTAISHRENCAALSTCAIPSLLICRSNSVNSQVGSPTSSTGSITTTPQYRRPTILPAATPACSPPICTALPVK